LGKIAQRESHPSKAAAKSCVRVLASCKDYRVIDLICGLGPADPIVENAFPTYRVAAVVRGSFAIRSSLGDGVPVAGSLVIGNACGGYACRHCTPGGDRCVAFDFSAGFLERVREGLGAGSVGERFRLAVVPPSLQSAAMSSVVEAITAHGDPNALEEAALEMAVAGLTTTQSTRDTGRKVSAGDERKIMLAARYIEAHFDQPCTLSALAADAGMSTYHFLRVFRRVTGQTPHRYVLATRLRYAAHSLATTPERIIDIANTAGFGDISNFNAAFVRAFRASPTVFRARMKRAS
jgi:AraC family transcriptional regulator